MNIQPFIDTWNGKPCETEDPANLDQCFDLAFAYCDWLNIPRGTIRHLNAYQIYTDFNSQTADYFDRIGNAPNNAPQAGDVVVWGTQVGSAGHVAVARGGSDSNNLYSFDQNWNFHHYCEPVNHTYFGVIGWLRPKVKPQGGDVNVIATAPDGTTGDANFWMNAYWQRNSQWASDEQTIAQLKQQVSDLAAQVQDLGQKLADATKQPVTVPTVTTPNEQSQQNGADSVVITESSVWTKFKAFINKLFQQ